MIHPFIMNEQNKPAIANGTAANIISPENLVYRKPELMNDVSMHYCPGCSHGVVHKLIAEIIAEMGLEEKTIGISPVGCAVFAYRYIDIDWQEAAHGRAPALATALYSPIRATATWHVSARPKQYMHSTGAKTSPSSLSTTPFMA